MRALGLERGRPGLGKDVIALLAACAYVLLFAQVELGHKVPVGIIWFYAPLALIPVALLRRIPMTRAQSVALATMTLLPLGITWALLIELSWLTAVVVPAMVIAAILCSRWPAAAVALLFACATSYGSMRLYLGWSAQKTIDVLLGGLWLAAVWRWFVFPRPNTQERPLIWPAVAMVTAYVVFTAGEIMSAESLNVGLQSFRQSTWYLAAALLMAYGPWTEKSRERMQRVALVTIVLVGAYATLRWAIGPSGKEEGLAKLIKNNFNGDKLRPIGSMITVKELAAWSAFALPFAAGMALWLRGRWRLVAIVGGLLAATTMFFVDVRAAPAGAIPGAILALVLYATSQGFRGRRGATVGLAVLSLAGAGIGAFALTVGGQQDSGSRYEAILNPTNDTSYQGRLIKWRTAWDDIGHKPFGYGLGTSGIVQTRFGKAQNIGSISVDNSYLKIAYEQGFIVMVLFAGTLILLLLGLGRRALVATEPARAGPALAACGTLLSMLILFFIGNYVEGIPVLAGWLMVGLGLRQFVWTPREPTPTPPEPQPGNAW